MIQARLVPDFTSLRHSDPGYAQLTPGTPSEIRAGASGDAEMGAFYRLRQPLRMTHFLSTLAEHLPDGRDVGVFKYPEQDFETEWITDRSIDYLRSRKDNPQPWFLFSSYLKPHSPSVEPKRYLEKYDPNSISRCANGASPALSQSSLPSGSRPTWSRTPSPCCRTAHR